jgi:hypothetical protein
MSFKEAMLDELDKELLASKAGWDEIRLAENDLLKLKAAVQEHDIAAHRLRMALFSLDGEKDKHFGDANAANHDRIRELLRGDPR